MKYFNPKGQAFTDSSRATGIESLTGTDLMGAIGFCQSKSPFGIAAVMAKTGNSEQDAVITVQQLMYYARRTAPPLVRKAAGHKLGRCLVVLSKLAFDEYSRSAATDSECPKCDGHGFHVERRQVVKYPGYISALDGKEKIPPLCEFQEVRENCTACKGMGKVKARCRCNGTGRVRDVVKSACRGAPVDRECERCKGRGYKRMPSSIAFRAISVLVPDLTQSSWSRNWKPFFENLVVKCEIEENHADAIFRQATK
nr:antitermination protein [Pantoea agglomerans]